MNDFYKILKPFLLFVICFLTIGINIFAQDATDEPPREKQVKNLYVKPIVRGFSLHVDIASPFMGIAVNKNVRTLEFHADINLFDKIFPIIEGGFGSISAVMPNGSSFRTAAPFFRLGLNYCLLNNTTKEGTPKIIRSYPFLGVRYGFSVIPYQIDNVHITSGYWGEGETLNYHSAGAFGGWLEIVGGVRVDIKGGFTMGWNVRLKTLFHAPKDKTKLWFAPGYGLTENSAFGFNYTIGYTFRAKTHKVAKKTE